jgi:hypothetical protein
MTPTAKMGSRKALTFSSQTRTPPTASGIAKPAVHHHRGDEPDQGLLGAYDQGGARCDDDPEHGRHHGRPCQRHLRGRQPPGAGYDVQGVVVARGFRDDRRIVVVGDGECGEVACGRGDDGVSRVVIHRLCSLSG